MTVEIALIPEAGVAESAQQVLEIVEVDRAVEVGVADDVRLDDDLTRLEIGIENSGITSSGVGDSQAVGGGVTADQVAAVGDGGGERASAAGDRQSAHAVDDVLLDERFGGVSVSAVIEDQG